MVSKIFWLSTLTATVLAFAALFEALMGNTAIAQSAVKTTQTYRTALGSASPALDIYAPAGARAAPVLIYVHGGAWVAGRKSAVHTKPGYFNSLGYVFVSVEYRLVPKVEVTGQLADIDAALAWVADNISKYGGDPSNLNLMGHSAGAHLVSMTAVSPLPDTSELIDSGALRTVISNDTRAYDIPGIAAVSRKGSLPRLYVRAFGEDTDFWHAMSPIYQVTGGRRYPAFLLLFSGQGNDAVRAGFALDFAAKLCQAGVPVSLFNGQRFNHRGINVGIGKDPGLTNAITDFLAANTR